MHQSTGTFWIILTITLNISENVEFPGHSLTLWRPAHLHCRVCIFLFSNVLFCSSNSVDFVYIYSLYSMQWILCHLFYELYYIFHIRIVLNKSHLMPCKIWNQLYAFCSMQCIMHYVSCIVCFVIYEWYSIHCNLNIVSFSFNYLHFFQSIIYSADGF